jgi:predicted PurR-regulated permease PerM
MTPFNWGVIMLIVAVTIFSAIMGALAPTIVNLYLAYLKEPVAPKVIRIHPYRLPFVGMAVVILISGVFVVYAAVRENNLNEGKNTEVQSLEQRVDALQSKLEAHIGTTTQPK